MKLTTVPIMCGPVHLFHQHGCFSGILKQHNPSLSNTKCFMADKDMTERRVISETFPDATLQICLFHVLRTFRFGVFGSQRQKWRLILCHC